MKEESHEIYEPKFMEWGIINKSNFEDIYQVPIKRWDPLSTITIETNEFGLHRKEKRYHGHYSYLSPIRGTRPKGFKTVEKRKNLKEKDWKGFVDVFKAVTEGKPIYNAKKRLIGDGNTIIITEDESKKDNPFSSTPHKMTNLSPSCKALTLINRYPSMARIVEPEIEELINIEISAP